MTSQGGISSMRDRSETILVTTSLEESWPDAKGQILFLGQWCQRFSRRSLWNGLQHQVVPYHWDTRAKLAEDYRYLTDLYERALLSLHRCLNEVHNTDHGVRYWRMVAGPWLWRYLHVLFDRFEVIRTAEAVGFDTSIVLDGALSLPPPTDTTHAFNHLASDTWNHAVFARILSLRGFGDRLQPGPPLPEPECAREPPKPLGSLVRRLFDRYNTVAVRAFRENDVVMHLTYLDPREELRLGVMLGQVPCIRPPLPRIGQGISSERDRRAALTLDLQVDSPFESAVAGEIRQDLPIVLLEGFEQLERGSADLPWPTNPRAIWTSNAHCYGDVFNVWAAEKTERGIPLIIGQHGGGGSSAFNPLEDHERNISDVSLTWGWTEPNGHRYEPVGHFPAVQPLKGGFSERPNAILVSQGMTRCAKAAFAGIISSQWLNYFDFQSQFIESLPEHVRRSLVIRTARSSLGFWEQVERWESRHPNVKVDDGEGPLLNLVKDCRLYVATANSTTFLQAFHLGIPTILLWDPAHNELRDSADGAFRALESVGVYHPDPVHAAEFIGEIWTNTDAWWRSVEVQSVVNGFNDRFNRCPPDLLSQIKGVIHRTADAAHHNKNFGR